MNDPLYFFWSAASPYRAVPREQVIGHPAAVRSIAGAQHRDSLTSAIVYTARVEFVDGAHGEMRTRFIDDRDGFVDALQARMAA